MKRTKSITAAELMAQLSANPEYLARRRQREEERKKIADERRRAEVPLVEELWAAGFPVESAWDLVNTAEPYAGALPVLLEHLARPYPGRVKEGIGRALAVKEARFAWPTLLNLFRSETDEEALQGFMAAFAVIADEELIGDIITLAHDPGLQSKRRWLVYALSQSRTPEAIALLREMTESSDRHLQRSAREALAEIDKKRRRKKPRFGAGEHPEFRGLEADGFAKKYLRKVRTIMETWETVLEDKQTGELWVMDYPEGDGMNGPARLRKIGNG